jgi:hypothetical protein
MTIPVEGGYEMVPVRRSGNALVRLLIVCLFLVGVPAHAGMVSTTEWMAAVQQMEPARDSTEELRQRDAVRAWLLSSGVDVHEAQARIDALTAAEVQSLAGRLEGLPAGGVSGLEVVAIVGIVLLITDVLGYTNVYTFVGFRG